MNLLRIIVFLIALTAIDSFNKLVPHNKEVIYSWTADVKAGDHLPVSHASQFTLYGKIHLQSNNDSVYIKLSDLTYRLYNGITKHVEKETRELPVPKEVDDLENVFRVVYNDEGIVKGISTQNEEKEFSRNIKKAIATIFQLNNSTFDKEYHHSESFYVKENTIFGHGEDVYSIFERGEDIEVHKLHQMSDSEEMFSYFITNAAPTHCDVKPEETATHDSHKVYVLIKQNDTYLVKNISTTGSIVNVPFKDGSEGHVILVRQIFHLEDVISIQDKYKINSEHFEKSLAYRPFIEDEEGFILDITNGRHEIIYEKLIPLVQNLLKDISKYFEEDHMKEQIPDLKDGQLINRVQRILLKFSFKKLEQLRLTLSEETLKSFYHVLPLVGSEASTLYIKTLIVEKTVDENTAINLLQFIAENIRPSLNLVSKMEDLIHLNESFSWDLRKVAILNFGNVIRKSYKHYTFSERDSSIDIQKPYEKYIEEYIDNLKNSNSYQVQFTYLLGLRNMRLPLVSERLIPALKGEWFNNPHLRYMSIVAASPHIAKYPYKVMKYLWPIFTNQHERTELRILAYFYIILSQPSLSTLRSIFTFMSTEPDQELYHFHYTAGQALAKSNNPCHQRIIGQLAQMIKFARSPQKGASSVNFFGYVDPHYGFGGEIQNIFMKTNESRIYAVHLNSQQDTINEEKNFVYLKIRDGSDENFNPVSSIMKIFSMTSQGKDIDFHIEACIATRGKIINVWIFDKSNIQQFNEFFTKTLMSRLKSTIKNIWYIMTHLKYQSSLIPTDLGIPAFKEHLMPGVFTIELNISTNFDEEIDLKGSFEARFNFWSQFHHGLTFYNPIADVWQGINRFQSFDVALPLHFSVFTDPRTRPVTFQWKKYSTDVMNVAGMNSRTDLVVFVEELYDSGRQLLRKFIPHGEEFQIIGDGKKFRHNYHLIEKDDVNTGYRFLVKMYDSDVRMEFGSFKNKILRLLDPSSMYFNTPLEYLPLLFDNFVVNQLLLPRAGSYGVIFKFEPSQKYPITDIDLLIHPQSNKLISTGENNYRKKSREMNIQITYTAKNEDNVLRRWNTSFEYHIEYNFTRSNTQLIRTDSDGQNYKICINSLKEMKQNEVDGHLRINMGDGSECVNDTIINITMKAEQSDEQKIGNYKPTNCEHLPDDKYLQCLIRYLTLRHYTYDIKTINIPNDLKLYFSNEMNNIRSLLYSYYSYKIQKNNIGDDSIKVDVEYPSDAKQVNFNVITNEEIYEFSGISTKYWDWFGFSLDYTTISQDFLNYEPYETYHCRIYYNNSYVNDNLIKEEKLLNIWNQLLGEQDTDTGFKMFVKRRNDTKLGLKVTGSKNEFEVEPEDIGFKIILNGSDISSKKEYHEDWVHYQLQTEKEKLIMFFTYWEVFVTYNPEYINIIFPRQSYELIGKCRVG